MKQTSVEWLFKNIWLNPPEKLLEILDKAKELENRQKDDYAIEFAEWVIENRAKHVLICGNPNIKQLLEIFKKEKDYDTNSKPTNPNGARGTN